MDKRRAFVKTKSTLGVGVLVGSGVAVGGRGVGVRAGVLVGSTGVGVWDGSGVAVADGVCVGGNGVGVSVGGRGVGVAVSIGVGVLVGLGNRVGVGVGVGVASKPHPTTRAPDNRTPTVIRACRAALAERWDSHKDSFSLTAITFPLRLIWDIMYDTLRSAGACLVPKVGFEPT